MSAKKALRGQIFGGIGLVLFAFYMLWRARFALLHHTVLFPRYPSFGKGAWLNPWQAVAVAAICFILGAVLVINAARERKKQDASPSPD